MDERFPKSEIKRGDKKESVSGWGLREKMERGVVSQGDRAKHQRKKRFPTLCVCYTVAHRKGCDVTHINKHPLFQRTHHMRCTLCF